MTTALIDADIVAYRAAAVSQENIDWQDGKTGPTLSKQQALSSAKFIVDDWTERAGCNKAILCFTGQNNFRRVEIHVRARARFALCEEDATEVSLRAVGQRWRLHR